MFFTGLFATHIPYIVLIAVYSVSFGIYSFYQNNKKTCNSYQSEKDIKYSSDIEFSGRDFYLQDEIPHKSDNDNEGPDVPILPDQRPKYSLRLKEHLRIVPEGGILTGHPGFDFYSRPPPEC